MHGMGWGRGILWVCGLTGAILAQPKSAWGQSGGNERAEEVQHEAQRVDLAAVGTLLQRLQSQVEELSGQVKSLKAQQESAQAESAELRKELDATKSQLVALSRLPGGVPAAPLVPSRVPQTTIEERIARLEENQQMADA